jgi:hypothetical protein
MADILLYARLAGMASPAGEELASQPKVVKDCL